MTRGRARVLALVLSTLTLQLHAPRPADAAPAAVHYVLLGAVAAAGIAASTAADQAVWRDESVGDGSAGLRAADGVSRLGSPTVLGPALVLGAASGLMLGRPEVTRASLRITAAVIGAGVTVQALKLAVGRTRPSGAPGDPDAIRPFSGHDSFPSGHTTIAFAAAAALDRETSARWVPFVAYPLAGLVGWSRIRQDRHWTSDVVAGALLGLWSADKVGDLELFKGVGRGHPQLFVAPGGLGAPGDDVRLGARVSF